MAVYRFRVTFEEHSDVSRDIEIKATQTFDDLHRAINDSVGFDNKHEASLFMSDEHWKPGQEYRSGDAGQAGVKPMAKTRLTDAIDDPHQKLYYTIHSDPSWDFQVELFKIQKEEPGQVYPRVVKTAGLAPKQYGSTVLGKEKTDLDFLQEAEFAGMDDEYTADAAEGDGTAATAPDEINLSGGEEVAVDGEEIDTGSELNIEEESFGEPEGRDE